MQSHQHHVLDFHTRQYATTDFVRHVQMTDHGLNSTERDFIERYCQERQRPILEVGCGTGRVAFGLERECGYTNIVAGDIVPSFIRAAHQYACKHSSSVMFHTCNALALPFSDAAFHVILCLGVMCSHLPYQEQRRQFFHECFRVLDPGGIVIVNAMNFLARTWYLPFVKALVWLRRWISNPYYYDRQNLPRLGCGGKWDPGFLRKDKPTLHYYYPGELVFDVLLAQFVVVECLTTHPGGTQFLAHGKVIYVVGRKD